MSDKIEPREAPLPGGEEAGARGERPRAWRGLRGFLKEYVIIVVGVLTALAGQAVVQEMDWHGRVTDAERDLKAELHANAIFAFERLVTVRCATEQIGAIRQALIDNRDEGTAVPLFRPYHRGFRPWLTDNWESARSLQLTGHIPTGRLQSYSRAYADAEAFKAQQGNEGDLIPALDTLADNAGKLSPAERDRLFLALRGLEAQSNRLDLYAFRYLEAITAFNITLEPNFRAKVLKEAQASFGACARDPSPWLGHGATALRWLITRKGEP